MQRKNSYIIINIEEMEIDKKQIIINAVKQINKEQSLLHLLLYINYYYLSYYLNIIFWLLPSVNICLFSKKFKIENICFHHNEMFYKSSCINDLILYDNGMILNDLFIPYENIIQFGYTDDTVYLDLFAKINKMEDNFTFSLGHNIVNVSIKSNSSIKIFKYIKSNLYYHIKYNKMNFDIVKYYYKKNL